MQNPRRQWGETPWQRSELPPHPKLDKTPDVVIVGGGLTGASTAYHLAKRGLRPVVLEAELIGAGASGRTGGLVLEGTASGPLDQVDSCVAGLEELVAAELIDCDLKLPGCWEIEHRDAPPEKTLPWKDNGFPLSIARIISGGVVQPAALLTGIATAAIRNGAVVCERTPVRRILPGAQLALELDHETIRPGYIVVATNAWTDTLLPEAPALRSCLTFACATEPLEQATVSAIGLGSGVPFFTADLPYLWGRTIADGRIVFGAGLVFGKAPELESFDVSTGHSSTTIAALEQRVRLLHPALAQVKFFARWGGPIAFNDRAVPILGRLPSCSRILVAGAYAGHGVALSVRAGELLALAIVENRPLPTWGALTTNQS